MRPDRCPAVEVTHYNSVTRCAAEVAGYPVGSASAGIGRRSTQPCGTAYIKLVNRTGSAYSKAAIGIIPE